MLGWERISTSIGVKSRLGRGRVERGLSGTNAVVNTPDRIGSNQRPPPPPLWAAAALPRSIAVGRHACVVARRLVEQTPCYNTTHDTRTSNIKYIISDNQVMALHMALIVCVMRAS